MKGVAPAPPLNRVEPVRNPPPPLPYKRIEDERAVLAELARFACSEDDDIEIEDDHVFLRAGLARDVLRKLKRAHWVIQDEIEARLRPDMNRPGLFTRLRNGVSSPPRWMGGDTGGRR